MIYLNKLSEIFDGWKNYTFPSQYVERTAKKRIQICVKNKCKQFKTNNFCKYCGCYMPAKVRSLKSKCGLGFW